MVLAPWTPGGLKIEYVEVRVFRLYQVQQINCYLLFGVCKCTHLAILTILHVMRVCLAELALVFFRVVELLHPVMRSQALLSIGYALVLGCTRGDFLAHLARVGA